MSIHRGHPDYSDGFFAALAGEPLAADAPVERRAGWEAANKSKQILADAGFEQDGTNFSKTTVVSRASSGPGEAL